jgi:hypothetical protein
VDLTDSARALSLAEGADKRAFEMALARLRGMTPFECAAAIQNSGPIAPDDIENSVGVYRRGMSEVEQFLTSGT